MRKIAAAVLSLCIALPMLAADAATEARNAETAFAKAFADRDAEKFFSMVLDDATFMGPKRTLSGKQAVRDVWQNYFKDAKAPFSWGPERIAVNAAGNLALSTGPVRDPEGNLAGYYSSVWQKQSDGSWKILFDGPGSAPPCPPAPPTPPAAPAPPKQ